MRLISLLSTVALISCNFERAHCNSSKTAKEFNVCEQDLRMDNRHDICFMRYWKEATVIPCSVVHQCIAESMK